jgi:hypothetical protein
MSGLPIEELQQLLAGLSLSAAAGSGSITVIFFVGAPGTAHPETFVATGSGQLSSSASSTSLPPARQASTQLYS